MYTKVCKHYTSLTVIVQKPHFKVFKTLPLIKVCIYHVLYKSYTWCTLITSSVHIVRDIYNTLYKGGGGIVRGDRGSSILLECLLHTS